MGLSLCQFPQRTPEAAYRFFFLVYASCSVVPKEYQSATFFHTEYVQYTVHCLLFVLCLLTVWLPVNANSFKLQ